jgi:hypothetical protein
MAIINGSLKVLGTVNSLESPWQLQVLDIQTDNTLDPGATPATGDRYAINNAASLHANFGSISGLGNGDLVEYDGSAFKIVYDASVIGEGAVVYSNADNVLYIMTGTSWVSADGPSSSASWEVVLGVGQVKDLGVTTAKLADDAVTQAKIASAALGSGLFKDSGDSNKIAVKVDASTIEIVSNTLQVKDAGITDAKIATGIDAAKIGAGSVSNTEFGYLDGVTSSIQTQFTGKQSTSEKGQANGYASLDGAGKVPVSQLPNSIMEYQGTWNASTNSPTLADGTGSTGDVYRVSVAGSQNLGSGSISFDVGDYAIYNGSIWEKADTTDAVSSVNGTTGAVTVNAINQLTGDVTTSAASGSESKVATIANNAVTTVKIADAAITSAKLADDSVSTAALDYVGLKLRTAAATDAFSSTTRTFTHSWGTKDVMVEVFDNTTGETILVDSIIRTTNAVAISVHSTPTNSLRVLIRELDPAQTTLSIS